MRRLSFCNAIATCCNLCGALLNKPCEAGDVVAGFAALLGRFLPRLGPFGRPGGPFSFAVAGQFRAAASAGRMPTRRWCPSHLLHRSMIGQADGAEVLFGCGATLQQ